MTRPNAEQLHEDASRQAGGLTDFGDPSYREGLSVLLAAGTSSPASGPALDRKIAALSTYALTGRLHSEAGWRDHPETRSTPVPAPVIVIGLPRSGTTALHQLMACDDQFQWIPAWLADRPRPRPPREDWDTDPLHRSAVERYAVQGANPNHEVGPDDPQECLNVMVQSFTSMMFVSTLPVPEYHEWFLQQDERPSYRRYLDNLRLIGDGDSRTWLLKNPSHTFALDALLDVLPDARVVWIHRDPAETIPSGCSLVFRGGAKDVGFRPAELGAHRLRIWSTAARRAEAAREKRPAEQFHDVDYRRFVHAPVREVRAVYEHFDLAVTSTTEKAFQGWVDSHPQDRHGRHSYTPEDFGLSTAGIRDAFGPYLERLDELTRR